MKASFWDQLNHFFSDFFYDDYIYCHALDENTHSHFVLQTWLENKQVYDKMPKWDNILRKG